MPDGLGDHGDPVDPGDPGDPGGLDDESDRRHLALEKKRERFVWYYLAYFLFGIHIVAFVMIYAVTHAK
jgi:hypothetical protein